MGAKTQPEAHKITLTVVVFALIRPPEEADVGSEEAEGAPERRRELRASSQPVNASIQPRGQRKPRAPQGGEEAEGRDPQPAGQASPSPHLPADPSPHTD